MGQMKIEWNTGTIHSGTISQLKSGLQYSGATFNGSSPCHYIDVNGYSQVHP
jgi:hypothetical protein